MGSSAFGPVTELREERQPSWRLEAGIQRVPRGPHVLVDEPAEKISPFDVGHAVGRFDGSETFGYLKLQSPMYPTGRRYGTTLSSQLVSPVE